jgi:hypothetical protein
MLDDRTLALLAERARAQGAQGGLELLGGLLQAITKRVTEAAPAAQLVEHLATGAQCLTPR